MICLGILVDKEAFTLEVPASRLEELRTELTIWQKSSFFTKKQLQSLFGKLSFVTACVKPGTLFMARLIDSLRECKHAASYRYPISATMLLDIQWWLEFLPCYRGILLIKSFLWNFESQFFHRRLPSRWRCHLSNGVHQFCLPRLHFYVFSSYKCTRTFHDSCRS